MYTVFEIKFEASMTKTQLARRNGLFFFFCNVNMSDRFSNQSDRSTLTSYCPTVHFKHWMYSSICHLRLPIGSCTIGRQWHAIVKYSLLLSTQTAIPRNPNFCKDEVLIEFPPVEEGADSVIWFKNFCLVARSGYHGIRSGQPDYNS